MFCLPDGYEVVERSLDDIRHVLDPTFSSADVAALDKSVSWARTLEGADYMPGLVGLNDMRANDYGNVIIQARPPCLPLLSMQLLSIPCVAGRTLPVLPMLFAGK